MNNSTTVILEPVLPPMCFGTYGSKYGSCPQVLRTNRNSFVVQGNVLDNDIASQMSFPANEAGVEIPEALLLAIADELRKSPA